MPRFLPAVLALLAAACTGEHTGPVPTAAATSAEPAAVAPAPTGPVAEAPERATASAGDASPRNPAPDMPCGLDGHVQFVNAFAQFAPERGRYVTEAGRAQLGEFDMTLMDYQWRRPSDGAALEVELKRNGSALDVAATPVERDADDNPVRTLGPTRHYRFEHTGGCWRYAGAR